MGCTSSSIPTHPESISSPSPNPTLTSPISLEEGRDPLQRSSSSPPPTESLYHPSESLPSLTCFHRSAYDSDMDALFCLLNDFGIPVLGDGFRPSAWRGQRARRRSKRSSIDPLDLRYSRSSNFLSSSSVSLDHESRIVMTPSMHTNPDLSRSSFSESLSMNESSLPGTMNTGHSLHSTPTETASTSSSISSLPKRESIREAVVLSSETISKPKSDMASGDANVSRFRSPGLNIVQNQNLKDQESQKESWHRILTLHDAGSDPGFHFSSEILNEFYLSAFSNSSTQEEGNRDFDALEEHLRRSVNISSSSPRIKEMNKHSPAIRARGLSTTEKYIVQENYPLRPWSETGYAEHAKTSLDSSSRNWVDGGHYSHTSDGKTKDALHSHLGNPIGRKGSIHSDFDSSQLVESSLDRSESFRSLPGSGSSLARSFSGSSLLHRPSSASGVASRSHLRAGKKLKEKRLRERGAESGVRFSEHVDMIEYSPDMSIHSKYSHHL